EAQRRLGDGVDLRLARAQYWTNRRGADALPAVKALAEGLDRFPAAGRTRLLRGLAVACTQLAAPAEARPLWTRLAREQPTDIGPQFALLDLALQADDDTAARHALDEIQRLEGPDG